eukprot:Hpha_TRINITY_DN30037_c0_g1::TRINITY_DN30037_c0_g1_i1::g.21656::m.21656/K13806/DAGL; sn1-specific diacylglycerol lipase
MLAALFGGTASSSSAYTASLELVRNSSGKLGWTRDCETLEIVRVVPGGAADKAGVTAGMRIVAVDGTPVRTDVDCSAVLSGAGERFFIEVELPIDTSGFPFSELPPHPAAGFTLEDLKRAAELARNMVASAAERSQGAMETAASAISAASARAAASARGLLPAQEIQELAKFFALVSAFTARHKMPPVRNFSTLYNHLVYLHNTRGPPYHHPCPPELLRDSAKHFRFAAAIMGSAACSFLGITPMPRRRRTSLGSDSDGGSMSDAERTPRSAEFWHNFEVKVAAMCDITPEDVVFHAGRGRGAVFQPARMVCRDDHAKEVVVALRGSMSTADILTDLSCESVECELEKGKALVHRGFLESARVISPDLETAIRGVIRPGDTVVLTGHSLGAAVAAMLCELWAAKKTFPGHRLRCFGFGAPCVFDRKAALNATPRILSVVNGSDLVSRLSLGSVERLAASFSVMQEVVGEGEDLKLDPRTVTHTALFAAATQRLQTLDVHAALLPGGRVVVIDAEGVPRLCEDQTEFEEIRLEPASMLVSHMPNRYFAHLDRLPEPPSPPASPTPQ